jgi:hypothetical protein
MYMYFAFCRLNTFSPLATTAVFGSYLSSLYSYPSLYRRCRFTYQNDGIGFVGPKKKTSVGLLVFNPLSIQSSLVSTSSFFCNPRVQETQKHTNILTCSRLCRNCYENADFCGTVSLWTHLLITNIAYVYLLI